MSDVWQRRRTREVAFGSVVIGGGHGVAVQSMTATKTTDVAATAAMVCALAAAGAAVVRIAVDTPRDADALREIRDETAGVTLSVDLQENWRLAERVAPYVDKIRYNPGHLHHAEPHRPWQEKVRWLAEIAAAHHCAMRVGVNCGSLDPNLITTSDVALTSAVTHSRFLDEIGFTQYCVSLKDSSPRNVVAANRAFAAACPDVPLHLGLTEAGLPPEGVLKSRLALEPLLADGIGETMRVSLTVPNYRKHEEIDAARAILAARTRGDKILTEADWTPPRRNIISCPSCARVENEAFVQLAEKVRDATQNITRNITIAVMGCRVNGPGETDHADFGLWCGANKVCLKRKTEILGEWSYDEIIQKLLDVIDCA